ncbi:MAG: radical SAM protein, partial [Acidimicrobiales bacterium]
MSQPLTSAKPLLFLWLEITTKCPAKCTHCYNDSGPDGTHGTMATEDWTRLLDEAADHGVRAVQLIGGEVTLHPGLSAIIAHALSRALAVEVFSNLISVTDEQWEAFSQPGVTLATSYYSDDAEQHNAITQRPTYERTKANVAKAVELGIPLRAGVIDLGGGQRTEEARAELVDLGVPSIGYDRLRAIGRGACGTGKDATQLCGQCGNGAAAVMADGTVRPCIMARWISSGNVQTQTLGAAVEGMAAARAELLAAGMPEVTARGECTPATTGTDCYPHNRFATGECTPATTGTDCYPHNRFAAGECTPATTGTDCYPHNRFAESPAELASS